MKAASNRMQPIPDIWEGLTVQVLPLLPKELADDLEKRLTALHNLGAAEFDDGEERLLFWTNS